MKTIGISKEVFCLVHELVSMKDAAYMTQELLGCVRCLVTSCADEDAEEAARMAATLYDIMDGYGLFAEDTEEDDGEEGRAVCAEAVLTDPMNPDSPGRVRIYRRVRISAEAAGWVDWMTADGEAQNILDELQGVIRYVIMRTRVDNPAFFRHCLETLYKAVDDFTTLRDGETERDFFGCATPAAIVMRTTDEPQPQWIGTEEERKDGECPVGTTELP